METKTIEPMRARLFASLRKADQFDRLRIVTPQNAGTDVFIHAKVCIVDDEILRIGSCNLTDRSMGADLECDLVLEAPDHAVAQQIRDVRNRLVGNHLGLEPSEVDERWAALGSLVAVVDESTERTRSLQRLEVKVESSVEIDSEIADPEKPRSLRQYVVRAATHDILTLRGLVPQEIVIAALVTGVCVLGGFAAWRLAR